MSPVIQHRNIALAAAAVAVGAALVLAGCVAAPPASEPPAPEPSATTATSLPPSEPTPSATFPSDPTCESLAPLDEVRSAFPTVESFPSADLDPVADTLPGEVASATAAGARNEVSCLIGVPSSDTTLTVSVLEIDETARDDLIAALGEAEGYVRQEIDADALFVTAEPVETDVGLGSAMVSYAFDGDAWAVAIGSMIDADSAPSIMQALLDASDVAVED
jgi:hypothetical protein